jgi:hypothetical protein
MLLAKAAVTSPGGEHPTDQSVDPGRGLGQLEAASLR